MINLKNIKVQNNTIYADIIPVSVQDKPFKIEIDTQSREIIKNTRGKMDSYVHFAFITLLKSYDNTKHGKVMPKEDVVAWY